LTSGTCSRHAFLNRSGKEQHNTISNVKLRVADVL
jgi:hypothetical protein